MAVNLHTNHFRFGVNELAENTHGWHANEDTNPSAGVPALDTVFLLRFNVQETGGTLASNVDNTFEFRINGGTWTALTATSVGPRAVAATPLTNGGNCTKRLSGTGTFESSGAGQTTDGTSGGNANDIAASGCSETECGIIIDAADVSNNDSIEFRITSPDFTVTNDVVPTLTIVKAVSLTVADGAQAQTTDNVVLVPDLVIADATQAQSPDNVVLTLPATDLAIQDGTQDQVADNVVLVPDLVVADAAQSQSADNVELTLPGADLVVADAAQDQSAENIILVPDLVVDAAAQEQTAENVVLAPVPDLVIADAMQAQVVDEPRLEVTLSIADAAQEQLADNVELLLPVDLVLQDAIQAQTIGNVSLGIPGQRKWLIDSRTGYIYWKTGGFIVRL